MKNILPIAAIIGAGALLINYLKGKKKAMENLQFEIFKISIDKQKTERALYFKIYYDIVITVINEELSPVKIKDTLLNIKVNGRDLGKVESTLNLLIPRESEKQITLKASFFTLGAIGLVKDIVQNGLQANVNVEGFINTDLGQVNVDFNKNLGGAINAPYSYKVSDCMDENDCETAIEEIKKISRKKGGSLNYHERRRMASLYKRLEKIKKKNSI